MSKQHGRGGMGSHKHGVSGTALRNRRAIRIENVKRQREEESQKRKRRKPEMFEKIEELLK